MKIDTFAARLEKPAYAALRIITGALFAFYGMQKLFGWYAQGFPPIPVGSLGWWAGIIELVCGTLIAIGLFTRLAAFLASGEMAYAYIIVHWQFAFSDGKWIPSINKGEPALIYCFLFLFIAAHGSGAASLDCLINRRRQAARS